MQLQQTASYLNVIFTARHMLDAASLELISTFTLQARLVIFIDDPSTVLALLSEGSGRIAVAMFAAHFFHF